MLVRRTALPPREIADSVGFSDSHDPSKTFRPVTGMTTVEFRRSLS